MYLEKTLSATSRPSSALGKRGKNRVHSQSYASYYDREILRYCQDHGQSKLPRSHCASSVRSFAIPRHFEANKGGKYMARRWTRDITVDGTPLSTCTGCSYSLYSIRGRFASLGEQERKWDGGWWDAAWGFSPIKVIVEQQYLSKDDCVRSTSSQPANWSNNWIWKRWNTVLKNNKTKNQRVIITFITGQSAVDID